MEQPKAPLLLRLLALPIRIPYLIYSATKRLLKPDKDERLFSRRRGHMIEMPVVTLTNPWTSTDVVLFGMCHIGTQSFYDNVVSWVSLLEKKGYIIMYEAVSGTEEDLDGLTENEMTVLSNLRLLMSDLENAAKILRITNQKDAIFIIPTWIRTDMNLADFIKRVASKGGFSYESPGFSETMSPFIRYFLGRTLVKGNLLLQSLVEPEENEKEIKAVVLGDRNKIAVEEIVSFSGENIASIWGEGHLPGIIDSLMTEYGYEMKSTQWLPAFTRDYFLGQMVRDMIRRKRWKKTKGTL